MEEALRRNARLRSIGSPNLVRAALARRLAELDAR